MFLMEKRSSRHFNEDDGDFNQINNLFCCIYVTMLENMALINTSLTRIEETREIGVYPTITIFCDLFKQSITTFVPPCTISDRTLGD
jgi:hypothetical protein